MPVVCNRWEGFERGWFPTLALIKIKNSNSKAVVVKPLCPARTSNQPNLTDGPMPPELRTRIQHTRAQAYSQTRIRLCSTTCRWSENRLNPRNPFCTRDPLAWSKITMYRWNWVPLSRTRDSSPVGQNTERFESSYTITVA